MESLSGTDTAFSVSGTHWSSLWEKWPNLTFRKIAGWEETGVVSFWKQRDLYWSCLGQWRLRQWGQIREESCDRGRRTRTGWLIWMWCEGGLEGEWAVDGHVGSVRGPALAWWRPVGSQTRLCPVAGSATHPCGGIWQKGDNGNLDLRLGLRAPERGLGVTGWEVVTAEVGC